MNAVFTVAANIGYPLVFLFVMFETGSGIPIIPGELAVLTAAIAASTGKLEIVLVIAIAAAGAIVGDNIGYLIGRKGGRWLFERPGPFAKKRREILVVGDWFFARHGPKAVFFGRWLPILRVYASWLAGGTRMRWRVFLVWNAAGGVVWAIYLGIFGYLAGSTAKTVLHDIGTYGLILVVIGVILISILMRRLTERVMAMAPETPDAEALARTSAELPAA